MLNVKKNLSGYIFGIFLWLEGKCVQLYSKNDNELYIDFNNCDMLSSVLILGVPVWISVIYAYMNDV